MDVTSDHIKQQIQRIVNTILFMKKKPLFSYGGIDLYPSEIHLMEALGEDQIVNAANVADYMGVTKGAISQTVARLTKKGVLETSKDPYNKNEMTMALTEKGRIALQGFKAKTKGLFGKHLVKIHSLSQQERDKIMEVLFGMEDFIKEL